MTTTEHPGRVDVLILVGPSGVGKTTLADAVVRASDDYVALRTCTTRPRRPDEPADAYQFVTDAEYDTLAAAGQLVAKAHLFDNRYGLPTPALIANPDQTKVTVLDPSGVRELENAHPELLMLVMRVERDEQTRQSALQGRPTDSSTSARFDIEQQRAYTEAPADYVVNNSISQGGPAVAAEKIIQLVDYHRGFVQPEHASDRQAAVQRVAEAWPPVSVEREKDMRLARPQRSTPRHSR